MPSAEKLQRSTDNKRAHALARIETRNGVDPADVDITERIFTSEEEFVNCRTGNGPLACDCRSSPGAHQLQQELLLFFQLVCHRAAPACGVAAATNAQWFLRREV